KQRQRQQRQGPARDQVARQGQIGGRTMFRGRRGGIESRHQEQRGPPQVPQRLRREVIRLIVGDGYRRLSGGGEADGVDAALDQNRLFPESTGECQPRQLSEHAVQFRLASRLLRKSALRGAHELGGRALRAVRGIEQRGLAGSGRARLPQHHRAIDQIPVRVVLRELASTGRTVAAAIGRDENQCLRVVRGAELVDELEQGGGG